MPKLTACIVAGMEREKSGSVCPFLAALCINTAEQEALLFVMFDPGEEGKKVQQPRSAVELRLEV